MTEQIQYLPPDAFDDDQRVRDRLNPELVEQLSLGFLTVGQLQPVRARRVGDRLVIVDGHHRRAAAVQAGLKTLACILEGQELNDRDILVRQLILNVQRENLSPRERARGIAKLMELTGATAAQVAAKLGLSAATVSRSRALLALPEPILRRVEAGEIPASAAAELAAIEDPRRQAELAEQLAAGQLTRDGVRGERKAARRSATAPASTAQPNRVTAVLGANRSVTVAAPSLSLERFIEVIEEVLAKARRVRTRGVELQTFVRLLRDEAKAGS
jgi:ParB/RepB/Spo0J family partition protein